MKKLILALALCLVLVGLLAAPVMAAKAPASTTVYVYNLQPSWTAKFGGGVFSAYVGPPAYNYVSPGATALYDGRQAGIIYAGVNVDTDTHYYDQGLFAFIPNITIDQLAAGALTYDVENQYGANPVWMTIEIDTGVVGVRSDNTTYEFVPAYSSGWNTVNAGAGLWQKWNDPSGDTTGNPLISLSAVAAANTGLNVVRDYLRLGMGDSYHTGGLTGVMANGTVGWVDKVTIGTVTYDFAIKNGFTDPNPTKGNDTRGHKFPGP
jgi:hypothetical protein